MLDLLREEQPQQVGRKPLQTLYTVSVSNTISQPHVLERIMDVLWRDDINGRLLILGQPGGGKTTTLLNLAEELIAKAKQNTSEPVPMIFELSTWRKNVSIQDWLVKQLKQKYSRISGVWLERGEILPLLDGLDELGLEDQRKCIEAINKYLAEDATRDLVVCCRKEQYLAGEEQLSTLRGAVCLQELSDGQIRGYLNHLNRGDLWQSIRNNAEFLELARTPLLLSMMVVAYQGRAIQTKEELFDAYIVRQFELLPVGKRELQQRKIMRFLVFLADKLLIQTEFLIENIEPDWWLRDMPRRIYGLIIGLIIGLDFGLGLGLIFEHLTITLTLGLGLGLIFGLNFEQYLLAKDVFDAIIQAVIRSFETSGHNIDWFKRLTGRKFEINKQKIPNQAIWTSAKKMVLITLLASLIFIFAHIWLQQFLVQYIEAKTIIRIINISQGLTIIFVFLFGGGLACTQHFFLRLLLWSNGYIPWNYAKFLSRAAQRRLIQQIGGRYRFMHRLLLEHFTYMQM